MSTTLIEEAHYELDTFHKHNEDKNATEINAASTCGEGLEPTIESSTSTEVVKLMNKSRFVAVFLGFFIQGFHDAVTGALLPYIQNTYNIRYAIASLVFVGNAIGFISAVPLIQILDRGFGRRRALVFAVCCNIVAYSTIIAQPPFAVVAVCFGVLGFGFSTILALNNTVVMSSANALVLAGIVQGGYGLGGTVSPLLGTAMVSQGVRWSFFYFISLALSLLDAALLAWSFRDFVQGTSRTVPRARGAVAMKLRSPVLQALSSRAVLLGSTFVFSYQGAEVTISGWIPSFLIDYRHGDPARVGYVTSGFWGGITSGRFLLCPLIEKLGDRRCIFALVLVWAGFHLVIWLARDIISNAVAVAIIGVLSGPVAPVATFILSKLLDPDIQATGIGMVWSIGSGGAAVAPFLTGLLAQHFGAIVLNTICIVLCVFMEIAWVALPGRLWKKD